MYKAMGSIPNISQNQTVTIEVVIPGFEKQRVNVTFSGAQIPKQTEKP